MPNCGGNSWSDNISGENLPVLPINIGSKRTDGLLAAFGSFLSIGLLVYYIYTLNVDSIDIVIFSFVLLLAIYFAFAIRRRQPWRPVLTISADGLVYRGFASRTIPWSSIEHISVLQLATRIPSWRIDIRLHAGAHPRLLQRATKNWAALTHAPGKPTLSISDIQFENYSYTEMVSLLSFYHRTFR